MSDEKSYSGHTAQEVIELMGMLAAEHDLRSADEALAIARRGYALLKDQASKLAACELERDELMAPYKPGDPYLADIRARMHAAAADLRETREKLKTSETRLDSIVEIAKRRVEADCGCEKCDALNAIIHYDPIENKSTLVEKRPPIVVGDLCEHGNYPWSCGQCLGNAYVGEWGSDG
jgi:hypothetical protein